MNKKGSMELSVNSIVILVIAIVMLGLILGFVKTKFSDLDKQLVSSEPDAPKASASDPLTVSRETIAASAGEDVIIKVQVYAVEAVASGTSPAITCTDAILGSTTAQGKAIDAGMTGGYIMKVPIIGSAAKGTYLCQLEMVFGTTNTKTKDIVIKIV